MPPYRNPTPPGVIIMTKEAAAYMKVVSPGSMQGPYGAVVLPGGVCGFAQWYSDVLTGLWSERIGLK